MMKKRDFLTAGISIALFILFSPLPGFSSDKLEEGTVSIAELYDKPSAYEGKKIRVKGEVAKFNAQIMERNWIHIQDGTEFEGKYDLTVTSQQNFMVGMVVTLEGILALNRDFGYGYSYELLLEEATAVE